MAASLRIRRDFCGLGSITQASQFGLALVQGAQNMADEGSDTRIKIYLREIGQLPVLTP